MDLKKYYIFAFLVFEKMFRKFTAILLILLANSVLLAHAFIPHHHHIDHICFHACDVENHDAAGMSGETDQRPDEKKCCLLADLQLFNSGAQRPEICCPFYEVAGKGFYQAMFALPVSPDTQCTTSGAAPYRHASPGTKFYTPSFTGFSHGLRAPPPA